jgi:uncharacterized protein
MTVALIIALLIMLIGLAGSIVPLLPGPPIIWLGAFFYAWQTDFTSIGWLTLLGLAAIAIAAATSDLWIGAMSNRKAGASGWATLFSTIGGIVGLFTLGLPGMILGSILGVLLPDWRRWREGQHVWNVSWRTVKSWIVGALVQAGLGIVMIVIFLIRISVG